MYEEMALQLESLMDGVPWWITNLSNAAALIYESLDEINWAGFYWMRNGALELGPFQGKVACTRIEIGRGVCGTAVQEDQVQRVEDVHQFPGHIACDGASNSEIVIPMHYNGRLVAVLDIDSPLLNRFTLEDQEGLERCAAVLEQACDWII